MILPRDTARPIWQEITPLASALDSALVDPDSTLFAGFGVAMTEGSFDVLVDGNRDGHYQPWADTTLPIEILPATGVEDLNAPTRTRISAIQPNPIRDNMHVAFSVAGSAQATLEIYDVAGRLIRALESARFAPGTYVRAWDGRDARGQDVGAGIYFVKLRAANVVDMKKVVRLR